MEQIAEWTGVSKKRTRELVALAEQIKKKIALEDEKLAAKRRAARKRAAKAAAAGLTDGAKKGAGKGAAKKRSR
jgi:hypothetical protein